MCFFLAGFIKSKNGEGGRIQTLPGVKKIHNLQLHCLTRMSIPPLQPLLLWKIWTKKDFKTSNSPSRISKKNILVIFVANLNKTKEIQLQRIHSFGRLACDHFSGTSMWGSVRKRDSQTWWAVWVFFGGVLVASAIFWGTCKGDDFLSYYTISFHIYLLGKCFFIRKKWTQMLRNA